jgi:hypothetical protein
MNSRLGKRNVAFTDRWCHMPVTRLDDGFPLLLLRLQPLRREA